MAAQTIPTTTAASATPMAARWPAACNDAPRPSYTFNVPPPQPPQAYNDQPPPPPAYDRGYDRGYAAPAEYAERETVWAYGRHGARYRVLEERVDRDGCALAESPVYMPDGSVERRFVRVCPDYRGRYRVVD